MENNKNKLVSDEEIKKADRKKQLAIIKASNEMLAQARETVMNTDKLDDVTRTKRVKEIDQAIELNYIKAERNLNATKKEVEGAVYGQVTEEQKRKYAERLKKLGKTEEDIERKDIAVMSVQQEVEKKSKRKHIPKKKLQNQEESDKNFELEDDVIERVANESELMKRTMATDESIRRKMGENTKMEDKFEKEIKDSLEEKKIKVVRKNKERGTEVKSEEKIEENIKNTEKVKTSNNNSTSSRNVDYSFDFSQIPDYVQYDMIPLPSDGKCYPIDSPLRCGRVPVAYLTASDENIIASPNMYRDGKIIDVILERKILDKRINVQDLVKGDRDAIVLWLRATGYGPQFPIVATNPNNGNKYDVNIDLSQLKYKDFNLESDDDGNFEFITNNGDVLKFNYFTQQTENDLRNNIVLSNVNIEKFNIIKYLRNIDDCMTNISISDEDRTDIEGCVNDIRDIIMELTDEDIEVEESVVKSVTEQMIRYTKSVNGNKDITYIKQYIENMRSQNSYLYRTFINENMPGVNFELTINIPESDGGGSFTTFLKLGNDVFINI